MATHIHPRDLTEDRINSIEDAAEVAVDEASERSVYFVFNDTEVYVDPGDNVREVVRRFVKNHTANRRNIARGRYAEACREYREDPMRDGALGELIEEAIQYRRTIRDCRETKSRMNGE